MELRTQLTLSNPKQRDVFTKYVYMLHYTINIYHYGYLYSHKIITINLINLHCFKDLHQQR